MAKIPYNDYKEACKRNGVLTHGGGSMKKYNKLIWAIFFVQLIVIAVVLFTAKVDDMTLAKGNVYPFNLGWELVREDGTSTPLQKLPYYLCRMKKS